MLKGMEFERKVTAGNLIEIVVIIVVVISAFLMLQYKTETLLERQVKLEKEQERIEIMMQEMERRLSAQFVRNEVMVEIKTQLSDIKAEIRELKK